MKILICILLFSFVTTFAIGQENNNCGWISENGTIETPIKIFQLTRSKSIAISGIAEKKGHQILYSAFVLYQCGKRTAINEWDGTQTCTIKQNKDSLIVEELYGIPNGKNLSVKWLPFYVSKYYFRNNIVTGTSFYRNDLRKYTGEEIDRVLRNFEQIKDAASNFDDYLLAVNRLFWAFVSGSKKADTYLTQLKKKYGTFDGAVGEEFDALITTYWNYKHQRK
jgi:hypothetical protein